MRGATCDVTFGTDWDGTTGGGSLTHWARDIYLQALLHADRTGNGRTRTAA